MERTLCHHNWGRGAYILESLCTPDIVILHLGYLKEFCSADVQA